MFLRHLTLVEKEYNRVIAPFYFVLCILYLFFHPLSAESSRPVIGGDLEGFVQDAQTGSPVAWVDLYIKELNRSASTGGEGRFRFVNLPSGEYTVQIMRIGYRESHDHIHIEPGDTSFITIDLVPNSIETETIVIEDHREHSHLQKPDLEMSGHEIRRKSGTTLAETVKDMPGLDQLTNGPAPARPVLRGLSGDRLLLLENGNRTGDLSATASDHAVTIEPVTAERIEVIRGPLALAYGTNTLSGIINVISHSKKSVQGAKPSVIFSNTAETVNSGHVSALDIEVPLKQFFFYTDFSYRKTNDLSTPEGTLKNTALETINGKTELHWQPAWGMIMASAGIYNSDYGIPPSPPDLGHPNGIDISLQKNNFNTSILLESPADWIKNIQVEYDVTDYFHEELTKTGFREAAFSLFTHHAAMKLFMQDIAFVKNIRFGFWSEFRNFEAGGLTNTSDSNERSLALWGYQEYDFNALKTSASLRIENKTVTPEEEVVDFRVGRIRQRSFTDFAASVKTQYAFTPVWLADITVLRAFRAPGIQELYADGPHAPWYAYEIGNADLNQETTYGAELGLKYFGTRFNFGMNAYYNRIDGYLFSQYTGRNSAKRADLRRYQVVGLDADIRGIEVSADLDITSRLALRTGLSYLQGELRETMIYSDQDFQKSKTDTEEALPFMPPFKGTFDLSYRWNPLEMTYTGQFTADQNRPGRFETPTAGYFIHDINMEYFLAGRSLLHVFSLSVENLTDQTFRRHLNRIKATFPEPGRNVKLTYKLFW